MKRGLGWMIFGAALGALFVAERRRPLRRQMEPGPERVGRNLAIGLLAGATTAASEFPVVAPAQRLAERGRLGLLRLLPMPRAVRVVLGFLLLDYTLYLWHRMNHHAPLLWRFHAVHHVDLDLDTTTGLPHHLVIRHLASAALVKSSTLTSLSKSSGLVTPAGPLRATCV